MSMLMLTVATITGSDDVANYDRPEEKRQRARTQRSIETHSGGG